MQGTPIGQSLNVGNVSELLAAAPSAAPTLIGYQTLKGIVPASELLPGSRVITSDVVKTLNASDVTLALNVTATGQVQPYLF